MTNTLTIEGEEYTAGVWYTAKSGSGRVRKLLEIDQGPEGEVIVWHETQLGRCAWTSPSAWKAWAGEQVAQPQDYKPAPHRRLPCDYFTRSWNDRQ
jgi:hypothetical protein